MVQFRLSHSTPPILRGLAAAGCCALVAGTSVTMSGCGSHTPVSISSAAVAAEPESRLPSVEVVHPKVGGIEHICMTPGTVEPFASADLYAKVSGFLSEQNVDIGDRVEKGQVLAKISVPEFEKQVEKDKATVAHCEAKIKQMEAQIQAATAQSRAAQAQVNFAKADVQAKTAYREFREKQFHRIKDLRDQRAVDDRLVDEKEDQMVASMSAENASKAAVVTAQRQADAADANVIRAKADLEDSQAELKVAQADLAKAEVFLGYTTIKSPYTGVITQRRYFPGDFVRSAESGTEGGPLLSVQRTDVMRIIVQVPDRDVPYVTVGDQVTVEIDALRGREFAAKVARMASSEDANTRTMRTEIDVPNTDGALRSGMYGRATMVLEKASDTAVMVPSVALLSRSGEHEGAIRVVRDGRLQTVTVPIGSDDGVHVEVTKGISANDDVVIRTSVPLADGAEVTVHESKAVAKSAEH